LQAPKQIALVQKLIAKKSEQDIINEVCAKHLMEIDSGASDDNEEDDTIVEKPGRRRDALAACHWQTLQQYIADINTHLPANLRHFSLGSVVKQAWRRRSRCSRLFLV